MREREKGRGACVVYDGNSCFKKKKRSGLFGVGGVGVGVRVGGDICDFSPASQIHSLLLCTCSAPEQYSLFIKETFISHLPLSSHLSPPPPPPPP